MKMKILPNYRQTVNGKVITIKNVKVVVFEDDDTEGFPASECRRFERAVEKVFPGWYHRFTKKGKHRKNCVSCRRYGKMGVKR
jgi:hypothetical protein